MTGHFEDELHLCAPPFQIHVSGAWLGRIWCCDDCRQRWEILGLTGIGEAMMQVTWSKTDHYGVDILDAEKAQMAKDRDRENRHFLKGDPEDDANFVRGET